MVMEIIIHTGLGNSLSNPRGEQCFETVIGEAQDQLSYDFSNLEVYYQFREWEGSF